MAQVTLATTGVRIMQQNPRRKSVLILNSDTTNSAFLLRAHPTAITSATAEIRLQAGGSCSFNLNDDGPDMVQAEWSGTCTAGTPILFIAESSIE